MRWYTDPLTTRRFVDPRPAMSDDSPAEADSDAPKKPWYKQAWAIAIGGVLAGAAFWEMVDDYGSVMARPNGPHFSTFVRSGPFELPDSAGDGMLPALPDSGTFVQLSILNDGDREDRISLVYNENRTAYYEVYRKRAKEEVETGGTEQSSVEKAVASGTTNGKIAIAEPIVQHETVTVKLWFHEDPVFGDEIVVSPKNARSQEVPILDNPTADYVRSLGQNLTLFEWVRGWVMLILCFSGVLYMMKRLGEENSKLYKRERETYEKNVEGLRETISKLEASEG